VRIRKYFHYICLILTDFRFEKVDLKKKVIESPRYIFTGSDPQVYTVISDAEKELQ
jgi:hypothetical protein